MKNIKGSVGALEARSSLLLGNDLFDLSEVFDNRPERLPLLKHFRFLKMLNEVGSSLKPRIAEHANLLAFVLQPPAEVENGEECFQVLSV